VNRDCQQVRDLLDSFLSDELSVETNHAVLRHLESCDECRSEVDRRRETRRLLSVALKDDGGVDVSELRARISSAIDTDRTMTWRRVTRYWPIAAMLVLTVSAAFWWTRRVDAAAYVDSADNHVYCTGTLPPDVKYDAERVREILPGPFAGLVDAIPHKIGDAELVDAHLCPYNGRDYVHAVYRDHGHLVSLFTEPSTHGSLPSAADAGPLPQTDLSVKWKTLKGFEVDSVATRQHHLFVVSDQASTIPAGTRDEILRTATQFVRTLEKQ